MAKILKQKFLLKTLRLKTCKASKKSKDYDFAPYDKQDISSLQQMSLDITIDNVSGICALSGSEENNSYNAFSNYDYSSPPSQTDVEAYFLTVESTNIYENKDFYEQPTPKKLNFDQVDAEFSPTMLYVCCKDYDSIIQGDLSLRFSDRVKLLHTGEEYSLVKNVLSNRCGYVPNQCIQPLDKFLDNIKFC